MGAFLALPFTVFVLAEVGCAIGAYVATTARARAWWAAGAAAMLLVGLLAALWLL